MKTAFILFAALCIAPLAPAADSGLLSLVMPDAKVIAGLKVSKAQMSPFGQYVLSHMQPDSADYQKFVADTNFDARRDLTEIVMASSADTNVSSHWLIVARGIFNGPKIIGSAQKNGATVTNFMGVDMLSTLDSMKAVGSTVAFLDGTSAAFGDADSVKAVIARSKNQTPADSKLMDKVNAISGKYDFWFATLAPVSGFAALMPDPNLGQAMKGNMLSAILQASGGVNFGNNIQFAAELVARSDKDAAALVDVVRFVAGMITLNRDQNQAAGQMSSLVDTMQLGAVGSVMSMSLSIPELQLEHLLESMQAPKQAAKKAAKLEGSGRRD